MTRFASRLLTWYDRNARCLPWRRQADPYQTWVSEIMLQQTRVATVIPFFHRWMSRFPSIRALAAAREDTVLSMWEGLGYYSRARNFHRAARIVVSEFKGRIPSEVGTLGQLPGVGPYTAAAIASIAFGGHALALDGNVRRVLSRVFLVEDDVRSASGAKHLQRAGKRHLPRGRAGRFNQALMDLGSAICLPREPRCDVCPVAAFCRARKRGLQASLPAPRTRRVLPHVVIGAAVIRRRQKVLLARRPSKGLLGGLWEFPNSALHGPVRSERGLARRLPRELKSAYGIAVRDPQTLGVVRHAYSHFKVTVHAFRYRVASAPMASGLRWVGIRNLAAYPMGKVDRQIADHLGQS